MGGTDLRSKVWGGTLSQVLGGIPQPGLDGGGIPSHVWGRGYPISGLGRGYPISGLGVPHLQGVPHLWGYPMSGGVPHVWGLPHVWGGTSCLGGYPLSGGGGGTPSLAPPPHCTEQHSEHLLCGGRCASCVHAGGLSCSILKPPN